MWQLAHSRPVRCLLELEDDADETLDALDPPDLTPLLAEDAEAAAEEADGPPLIPFIFWWLAQASHRGWVPPSRRIVPASKVIWHARHTRIPEG